MENKNVVYHGSSKPNLTRLEPFKCKHDKPYVYATKSYITVLFFSAKGQGMFDGWLEDDKNGIPVFYEAYPNSFHNRYWNKQAYCYVLSDKTFTDETKDPCEVVSQVAVDVIECKQIQNVGEEFKKLIENGKFKLAPYNTTRKNTQKKCEKYILKILNSRGYFEGKEFRQREWVGSYFKDLIEKNSPKNEDKQISK